jgi:hypothetical protein
VNEAHFADIVQNVRTAGYAVIPSYLSPQRLKPLQSEALRLFAEPPEEDERHPDGWREVIRAAERSEEFLDLHFDPLLVATAVAVMGPDVEFASPGEIDEKLPQTPHSGCGWHNDFIWMPSVPRPRPFFWLAAYYFLTDIAEDSGPLWVMPGSHLWEEEAGRHLDDDDGYGRLLPDSLPLTGAAGTLVLLNNEIWHMSPPNRATTSRIIFKLHAKPSWMKPWGGRAHSSEFCTTLKHAHERQLAGYEAYDDVPWQYGEDADDSPYPVVAWLAAVAPWSRPTP